LLDAPGEPQSATITGLDLGSVYYFCLVSADEASNVSDPSNVATAHLLATLTQLQGPPDTGFGFTGLGEPGGTYVVEASTDLNQWTAVATNQASVPEGRFLFSDPHGANPPQRFYRSVTLP
jgi:hypothetical protein